MKLEIFAEDKPAQKTFKLSIRARYRYNFKSHWLGLLHCRGSKPLVTLKGLI